jgi:hypothetical protein
MNVIAKEPHRLAERIRHIKDDLAIAVFLSFFNQVALGFLHEHGIGFDAADQFVSAQAIAAWVLLRAYNTLSHHRSTRLLPWPLVLPSAPVVGKLPDRYQQCLPLLICSMAV